SIMKNHHIALLGALALGACAGSKGSQQPAVFVPEEQVAAPSQAGPMGAGAEQGPGMHARGSGMMQGDMQGMCPMAVEGTRVRAEDVPGGVAVVFTTEGDV